MTIRGQETSLAVVVRGKLRSANRRAPLPFIYLGTVAKRKFCHSLFCYAIRVYVLKKWFHQ